MKRARLIDLYIAFLKIGGLTFGGGYAMLPMLQREVIDTHNWATEEEVLDIYAIGQCTPGIIAVNTATMIGYRQRGILGAIVASLGEITPSVVIISILATVLSSFQDSLYVQRAFGGIRIAVCALIVQSVLTLGKKSVTGAGAWLLFASTLALTLFFGFNPIAIVAFAILLGLGVGKIQRRKR